MRGFAMITTLDRQISDCSIRRLVLRWMPVELLLFTGGD